MYVEMNHLLAYYEKKMNSLNHFGENVLVHFLMLFLFLETATMILYFKLYCLLPPEGLLLCRATLRHSMCIYKA